ncbi:hypothetical protein [Variovorax sp. OV700]|uniref:hypothetical protein n=1 Tax=Variovorax sp. OV700 TaxID=1882826 RepID=UPI0011134A42|nr:hypothetical protein [Variovorax sp. OV700]
MSAGGLAPSPESELDELIALAEQTTASKDALETELEKGRSQLWLLFSVTTVGSVISMMAAISALLGGFQLAQYTIPSQIILIVMALLFSVGGGYMITRRISFLQHIKRDLQLEREICLSLLSMIDDQIQRVLRRQTLSPVALATIQIRIKRLDRFRDK